MNLVCASIPANNQEAVDEGTSVLPGRIVADRRYTDEQVDIAHDFREYKRRNFVELYRLVDILKTSVCRFRTITLATRVSVSDQVRLDGIGAAANRNTPASFVSTP